MATIRLLPPELVTKIAAGEVVERPASVVKELVENALDAGARAVRVEIQRGGLSLIRVSDNGSGIAPDQLELAVCRHATSKLAELDDLFRVRTLGFRGEALASIAAVSQLEIISRTSDPRAGRLLRVEGGTIIHQATAGCPEGTTISVRQLFFNVPARYAFQRSPASETRQIVQLCNQFAVAAPHVRLLVEVDGRLLLQAPGNSDLRETLAAAYGLSAAGHLLPLPELEEDGVRVSGYCSGPEEHRNTRLYCTICVNGRLVRSQMLSYAVEEAYHALLPGGRHPLAAIHLAVPPEDVDVNVHPTKMEIRLRRDRLVFSLVRNAVRQALANFAPVPALQPAAIGGAERHSDAPRERMLTFPGQASEDAPFPAPYSPPPSAPSAAAGPAPDLAHSASPGATQSPAGGLRALAQVGLTYIVAEDTSGVYLIDQHSAHERVLYEQLLRAARESDPEPAAQLLLTPEAVELNGTQAAWLQEHAATLEAFGFQLEPFGDCTWLLRAVPRTMAAHSRQHALGELVDSLIERDYGDGPLHDQARWAIACHTAVRAGDALAPGEMAALITQLERCDMRRTCPHGRPTMIHLSHAQLEREFGRR